MNNQNQQAIPNLTEEQAIRLNLRQDLPEDIRSQVHAMMVSMQERFYRESLTK